MVHVLRYFKPPPDLAGFRLLLHRSTTAEKTQIFRGPSTKKRWRPHDGCQEQNLPKMLRKNKTYAPSVREIQEKLSGTIATQKEHKILRDAISAGPPLPDSSLAERKAGKKLAAGKKLDNLENDSTFEFAPHKNTASRSRQGAQSLSLESGWSEEFNDAIDGPESETTEKPIHGIEAMPEKLITSTLPQRRLVVNNVQQIERLWARHNSHPLLIGFIFSSNIGDQYSSTCRKISPTQRKYLLKQIRLSMAESIDPGTRDIASEDVEKINVAALAFSFKSPSGGVSETYLIPKEETGPSFSDLVAFICNKWRSIVCFNLQQCAKHLLQIGASVDFRNKTMHDPKILAWLLQPELGSYELSAMVSSIEPNPRGPETFRSHPLDRMAADFKSVVHLQQHLERQLRPELQEPLRVETQLSILLAELEHRGVGIDLHYLQSKKESLKDHMDLLISENEQLLGHAINLASPIQVANALYEELKLPQGIIKSSGVSRKREAKSHKTTNEATLAELSNLHPFPALVLQFRHILKTKSTWIDGLIDKAILDKNGHPRVHASWNATNTATGRLSSSGPNLQNIPRSALQLSVPSTVGKSVDEADFVVRDAFVASEGHSLVAADYSQVELRLSAHISGDVNLINILQSAGASGDAFRLIASHFLEKPIESVTDEERQLVKRVCYGIMYGQGKQALGRALSAGPEQAAHMMQNFLDHFPSLKSFVNSAKEKARLYGCVQTLWGRTRPLPGIRSLDPELRAQAERQSVNTLIQGSAADIMKLAMLETLKLQERSSQGSISMLMEIHDELVFEVPDPLVASFSERVQHAMEHVVNLSVPLLVNVKAGKRWGSLRTVESRSAQS